MAGEIAIIGMAGRFPEADSIPRFWENLQCSRDSLGECPESRKKDIDEYLQYCTPFRREDCIYRKAAYLSEIDKFDYEFFHISPQEARLMDPHQRILLEESYHAIEDAGYPVRQLAGEKVGIYIGCPTEFTCKTYQDLIMEGCPELAGASFSGNLPAMLPARLAYYLNLRGPAMLVDTSCSSSLVAIHLAIQALQSSDCSLALAGGINIFTVPLVNTVVNAIGIIAQSGETRSFDEQAQGVGQGEGAGVVVLKKLSQAIYDQDRIYAVIRSSACNQDGRSIGITAPNAQAQRDVILEAWKKADVDPETITYIEAHGTATKLGDPTEISGVNSAFRAVTEKMQFCGIGSLKSNIGHTIGAAGVAGVIKAALALSYRQLPASIHLDQPNRKIPFFTSAVYVNRRLRRWDEPVCRCGVSSFGISGTNCHVVMEERPAHTSIKSEARGKQLFAFSAVTEDALLRLVDAYAGYLDLKRNISYESLCYTVNCCRTHFTHRIAILSGSIPELSEALLWIRRHGLSDLSDPPEKSSWKLFFMGAKAGDKPGTLEQIAQKYVCGECNDFQFLYAGRKPERLEIPLYPFAKERCWITMTKEASNGRKNYLIPQWKACAPKPFSCEKKQNFLVLGEDSGLLRGLVEQMSKSEAMEWVAPPLLRKKFYSEKEYYSLLKAVECIKSVHIIYVASQGALEQEMSGVMDFFHLAKAIQRLENSPLRLTVIAGPVYRIQEETGAHAPSFAASFGLCKALKWEVPGTDFHCLDTDGEESLIQMVRDLLHIDQLPFYMAYRKNIRWVEEIEFAQEPLKDREDPGVRENGVYVFIGGAGRIGRKLGVAFAERQRVVIVFVGRRPIPDSTAAKRDELGSETKERAESIARIRDLGSKAEYMSCDCRDKEKTKKLFQDIISRFGEISGVINCAVNDDGKTVQEMEEQEYYKSISTKMETSYAILETLKGHRLDFLISFSSVMTLISGKGAGAYTAGNCFLEAFSSCYQNSAFNTKAIAWPEWKGIHLDAGLQTKEEKSLFYKIEAAEALNLFFELLGLRYARIYAGRVNWQSEIIHLLNYFPFRFSQSVLNSCRVPASNEQRTHVEERNMKVKLTGRRTQKYSEAEKLLAAAWNSVMGYETVDVTKSFFELGGDSIFALRASTQAEEYGIHVSAPDILKYQSIEKIAELLLQTGCEEQKK